MRLPTVGGDPNGAIDEKLTAEMVAYARVQGVNYFDTAYGYHDGMSEIVMGKILGQYPRESFYLADSFQATICQTWTRWRKSLKSS